jgi:hypothetical protein
MREFISASSVLRDVPLWVLYILMIWELAWKGVALWKSAKNNHPYWYVFILVFNTIGILPIVYLAFFSKKTKK